MSKQVFQDLGFSEDEAREHAIRAEIAAQIALLIADRNLMQKEAAKLFRVPQPTISKIVSGNIANLSLAFFVRMLLRADIPFKICRAKSAEHAEVSIDESEERATAYEEVNLLVNPGDDFKVLKVDSAVSSQ